MTVEMSTTAKKVADAVAATNAAGGINASSDYVYDGGIIHEPKSNVEGFTDFELRTHSFKCPSKENVETALKLLNLAGSLTPSAEAIQKDVDSASAALDSSLSRIKSRHLEVMDTQKPTLLSVLTACHEKRSR